MGSHQGHLPGPAAAQWLKNEVWNDNTVISGGSDGSCIDVDHEFIR
jgi:hypothetical protein